MGHPVGHTGMLGALALGTFPVALFQSLVSPVLPVFERELGIGVPAATWIVTAYLLSLAIATPIVGKLGDLHGHRRVLLVAMAIVTVGTVVAAVASSLPTLLVGRILQGLGGGIFPLSFALVRDHLSGDRVARAIGLLSAVLGAGAGLGIAASGAIVDVAGPRALFWIPLLLLIPATVAIAMLVPRSPPSGNGRIDWRAASLLGLTLAAPLLAVTTAPHRGWASSVTLGLGAIGLVFLAAWIRVEQRSSHPVVDLRLFRIRGIWVGNVVAVMLNVGLFGSFLLLPRLASTPSETGFGFGVSTTQAGLLMVPLAVLMFTVAPLAGRVERHTGPRPLLVGGCLVAAAGFSALLVDPGIGAAVAASVLIGLGMGLAYGTVTTVVARAVPATQVGAATGVVTMTRTVGGAVSAQVVGSLIAISAGAAILPRWEGFQQSFVLLALALGCGAVCALAAPRR